MTRSRLGRAIAVLLLASLTASCAYYNTFYLAKKYYMKATNGEPYEVDRDGTTQRTNYNKSADYSKKLLGVYPKSKYVDDAWLMWARALVGTDDPLKAVAMLQEFQTRFPKSDLRPDAEFFLGLAYRQAHKYELAVESFDAFLKLAPRHTLVPYALYERSKAYMSLERYREAAESAGQILQRFPRHALADKALRQRAEGSYQQRDWTAARDDFHVLGDRALSDDERLHFLLREVDCLEASRSFEEARGLLRDARSHVPIPPPLPVMPRVGVGSAAPGVPVSNMPVPAVVRTPAQEVYGRLTLRMGDVELLDRRVDRAIELYRSVLEDYPRSQLSAEAQYRIGYAYETGSDDFERARAEYARVKEQVGMSQFAQQAQSRLDNLDRIDRYRTAAGADSLARKAEGRFLVAEHYLFSLDRPDRALEEYRAIFDSATTPAVQARALNAEAWLLARKLDRKSAADSLFWKVVREYPATEAQLAARDYLESEGQVVPDNLIVAPKDTSRTAIESSLTQPPATTPQLGAGKETGVVAAGAVGYGSNKSQLGAPPPSPSLETSEQWRSSALSDSLQHARAQQDSLLRMARTDTSAAGRARADSLQHAMAHADTLGRAAMMATIASEGGHASGVVVAPSSAKAPNLSAAGGAAAATGVAAGAGASAAGGAAGTAAASTPAAAGAASAGAGAAAAGGAPAAAGAAGAAGAVYGPPPPPSTPHADSTSAHSGAVAVGAATGTAAATAGTAAGAAATGSAAGAAGTGAAVGTAAVSPPPGAKPAPAMGDSAASAVRTDSLHKSVVSPKRVVAAPVAAAAVVPPVETHSKSIVSWDQDSGPKLTRAQRDSVHRAEKARKEAKRDSLKREAATRDSLKHAAKAPKQPAEPPSASAPPDTAKGKNP